MPSGQQANAFRGLISIQADRFRVKLKDRLSLRVHAYMGLGGGEGGREGCAEAK